MKKMLWVLALLPLVCAVRPVQAVPVDTKFLFTASDFLPSDTDFSAPTDPVIGSVEYTDDSGTLTLISLTLNLVKNLGSKPPDDPPGPYDTGDVTNFFASGGKLVIETFDATSADHVQSGHDDFIFQWDPKTGLLESFDYASVGVESSTFSAQTFAAGNPVSEPATLPLAVLSMGLIAAFAGRRRKGARRISPRAIASC